MRRWPIFLLFLAGPSSARAADICTTFAFSPDLKLEGNPLMAQLNFQQIVLPQYRGRDWYGSLFRVLGERWHAASAV